MAGRRRHRDGTNPGRPSKSSSPNANCRWHGLVVERKTNPQIAAELYLSQKTVETHLRNIFHKINVSSRVGLAHAIERADRTASPPPT